MVRLNPPLPERLPHPPCPTVREPAGIVAPSFNKLPASSSAVHGHCHGLGVPAVEMVRPPYWEDLRTVVKLPGNPSKKRMALLAVGRRLHANRRRLPPRLFRGLPHLLAQAVQARHLHSTSGSTASTSSASTAAVSAGGHWSVVTGSEAGYRVREKLGFLPAQSDAVGRTSSITGAAALTESKDTITIPRPPSTSQ